MDSDDELDGVMKGIVAALEQVQIPDDEARRVLLAAIRESMLEILEEDEAWPVRRGRPDVRVVEGGRGDEPPSTRARPQLRVAEAEVEDDEPTDLGRPPVIVTQVIEIEREDDEEGGDPDPDRLMNGFVGVDALRPNQMIFLGPVPRAYRLSLDEGSVWVGVIGEEPFLMVEGQRTDIEARRIEISLVEGAIRASGTFQRLPRSLR
jgi:hypothetical protein